MGMASTIVMLKYWSEGMVYFQCLWRIKARQSWALLVEEAGKGAQEGSWDSGAK